MAGYVPPHLKGSSGANAVATSKLAKYVPPHLKACIVPNSVATPKADDYVPPHLKLSSSASFATASKVLEYIPPHLKGASSANIATTSKAAQHGPPHPKCPSNTNSVASSKTIEHIPPHLIGSPGANVLAITKTDGDIQPHFRAKPTQACDKSALVGKGQSHVSSSPEVSTTAPLKSSDYIPPHLRPKSDFEKVSLASKNYAAGAISSGELRTTSQPEFTDTTNASQRKPMTQVSPSLTPRATSGGNGEIHPTIPAKAAALSADISGTSTQASSSRPSFNLACSWEEFTRSRETWTTTDVVHTTVDHPKALPMNTTSYTNAATSSTMKSTQEKQHPSISHSPADCASASSKGRQYTIKELVKLGKPLDMSRPIEIHNAIMLDICGSVGRRKPDPLTRDALIKITGAAPPESVISGVEKAVSDDGVEESVQLQSEKVDSHNKQELESDKPVPDARGNLAPEAIGLQEWNGSWAPVPCSWEYERNGFCNAFIPRYIAEWRKDIEQEDSQTVDMKADEFTTGTSALCNKKFLEPIQHPISYPGELTPCNSEYFRSNPCRCCSFGKYPEAKNAARRAGLQTLSASPA
jgi:hypothetical protein